MGLWEPQGNGDAYLERLGQARPTSTSTHKAGPAFLQERTDGNFELVGVIR